MPDRRTLLFAAGASVLAGPLAAPALAQERANPMPDELREVLERDPSAPVLGNPEGNITLTEFFDYNCPHCRTMMPLIQRIVGADPKLRVVLREWPVFGQGSDYAARASLAALSQGRYWQLHSALLRQRGRVDQASVRRAVEAAGLDAARLQADMEADRVERHITNSYLLADHMGLAGTPTFICGDEAAFGAMTFEELQALVARGRQTLGV